MEALKYKTLADLLDAPDERVELIDGDIVQRPMARMEHGLAQHRASVELGPFDHPSGPGGWWIATEVSVAYAMHQCPTHDLAGWRKERLPERPRGVVDLAPDWVCEIVSPGHERKDTLTLFLLLQRRLCEVEFKALRKQSLPKPFDKLGGACVQHSSLIDVADDSVVLLARCHSRANPALRTWTGGGHGDRRRGGAGH